MAASSACTDGALRMRLEFDWDRTAARTRKPARVRAEQ